MKKLALKLRIAFLRSELESAQRWAAQVQGVYSAEDMRRLHSNIGVIRARVLVAEADLAQHRTTTAPTAGA